MEVFGSTWNDKKCQGCWYNYEEIGICLFGDPGIPDDQKRNCEPEGKGEENDQNISIVEGLK